VTRTHRTAVSVRRPRHLRGVAGVAAVPFVFVFVFVFALALGAGLTGVERAGALAAGCSGPLSAGEIRVVVVVDPGDGGAVSSSCLVVPAGTTGSQVLARRAAELGTAAPRYGGSGLLCAIDAFPATGCGESGGGGMRYWANFRAVGGEWAYANYNPFTRRVADGDIEGWRFVDGVGNATDPPPRVAPSSSLFPPLAAPSVPTAASGAATGQSTPSTAGTAGVPTVGGDAGDVPVEAASAVTGGRDAAGTDVVAVEMAASPVVASTSTHPWVALVLVSLVVVALAVGAVTRSRFRA